MSNSSKFLISFGLVAGLSTFALSAHASLSPGDVVVVGITGDNTDQFTWVPLVNLAAGEKIKFTDNGWNDVTNTWSGNEEGSLEFTVPAGGIAAGQPQTVIFESENSDYTDIPEPGNGFVSGINGIATTGDQLLVWQGSKESPRLIYQVDLNASTFSFNPDRLNNSTALADGLVIGSTAVAVGNGEASGEETDGAFYQGAALQGTRSEILALISNQSNWSGSNNHTPEVYNNGIAAAVASLSITNTPPKVKMTLPPRAIAKPSGFHPF